MSKLFHKIVLNISVRFTLFVFGIWLAIIGSIWPKPALQAMINFCENIKDKMKAF